MWRWKQYISAKYLYVLAKLHCVTFQSHCSPISHPPVRTRTIAVCHSTYVFRRMRKLIVTSVIVFTRWAMPSSNAFHVRLSVRIGIDLDSHRGTLLVRRASCGDWTGPPLVTDGSHVAISCSLELPNAWESQISTSSQKCILYAILALIAGDPFNLSATSHNFKWCLQNYAVWLRDVQLSQLSRGPPQNIMVTRSTSRTEDPKILVATVKYLVATVKYLVATVK